MAEASDAHDDRQPPRADLRDAVGWSVLGLAVLVGSVRMDRLEAQNINPYTVPGLLPGLLGGVMLALGILMALRSWRRGAFAAAGAGDRWRHEELRRSWLVIGLCVGYCVVLVGHGIPFWLASSIYVTGSTLLLQRMSRDEQERRLDARAWAKALAIGVGSSVITQLVFQELFLVRMP